MLSYLMTLAGGVLLGGVLGYKFGDPVKEAALREVREAHAEIERLRSKL